MIEVIFILAALVFIYLVIKYINEIEKFEKVTRERLHDFEKENLNEKFHGKNPLEFGYEYEEIELVENGRKYYAWYIPSKKPSDKVIFFVHGRRSNSVRPLKYLNILKDSGIENYSVIIPDMRNSGKTYAARTYMGYRSADDIKLWIDYLNEKVEKIKLTFYSFSMGAMATALFLERYRQDFKNIEVEKIIYDSPLANVEKNIIYKVKGSKVKELFLKTVIYIFNKRVGGELDKMKLSYLFKDNKRKVLIFQSLEDEATPFSILKEELENIENIEVYSFEKGKHVLLYPENECKYSEKLKDFLVN